MRAAPPLCALVCAAAAYGVLPPFAGAQEPNLGYPRAVGTDLIGIINDLLIAAALLALFFFFWGMALFILRADEPDERQKGRQKMVWGVIALFVLVSVWGFVAILRQIFGTTSNANLSAPRFRAMPGVGDGGVSPESGGGTQRVGGAARGGGVSSGRGGASGGTGGGGGGTPSRGGTGGFEGSVPDINTLPSGGNLPSIGL